MTTDQDFEMKSGDTKHLEITLTDRVTGDPLPVADYTLRWVLRCHPRLVKTSADGIAILNATTGSIRITLAPADTEDLAGLYEHELQGTDTDGTVSTLCEGLADVQRDVA